MQTPDTKNKIKLKTQEASPDSELYTPRVPKSRAKRLYFDENDNDVVEKSTSSVTHADEDFDHSVSTPAKKPCNFLQREIEKLENERTSFNILLIHKKNELKDMRTPPLEPLVPLPAHGGVPTKIMCDKCHRRGHKAHGNKGGEACPYDACDSFKTCGNLSKHKEYKQNITEMEKEIAGIEKDIRCNEEKMRSLKSFLEVNSSNFVRAVRPQLQLKKIYIGKNGNQQLQKDIRFLKLATNCKIPPNLTSMSASELNKLIVVGRRQTNETFGTQDVETPFEAYTHGQSLIMRQPSMTTSGTQNQPLLSTMASSHRQPPIEPPTHDQSLVQQTVSSPQMTMYPMWPGMGMYPYMNMPFPSYSNMWYPSGSNTSSSTVSKPQAEDCEPFPPLPEEDPKPPLPNYDPPSDY